MRDATRGGLATVLAEFAEMTELGAVVEEEEVPITGTVKGLTEILGLDPLYLANEGTILIVTKAGTEGKAREILRSTPHGRRAQIIGRVVKDHPGHAVLRTRIGGSRRLYRLSGQQLPEFAEPDGPIARRRGRTLHEMSIMKRLFEVLEEIGEANRLIEISEVTVSIGGVRQVIPETFRMAFDACKQNTIAHSAGLVMELVPITIECEACGTEAVVTDNIFFCRHCGSGKINIIEGSDIMIKSIEGSV